MLNLHKFSLLGMITDYKEYQQVQIILFIQYNFKFSKRRSIKIIFIKIKLIFYNDLNL
jgi:hypothetical protein